MYAIDIEEGVDTSTEIPRMLIHTFVENAIKHGLVPKGGGGMLEITVGSENKKVLVKISDNGIGRSCAKKLETGGTGKGLVIIDRILDLYKRITKKKISYQIVDLHNRGDEQSGTRVEVLIT